MAKRVLRQRVLHYFLTGMLATALSAQRSLDELRKCSQTATGTAHLSNSTAQLSMFLEKPRLLNCSTPPMTTDHSLMWWARTTIRTTNFRICKSQYISFRFQLY